MGGPPSRRQVRALVRDLVGSVSSDTPAALIRQWVCKPIEAAEGPDDADAARRKPAP